MLNLVIDNKEYKIEYGFNSFCDTDLLERTRDMLTLFSGGDVENGNDVQALGMIKEMFCIVRELLFVGFEEHNPVEDVKEVGRLLDKYRKEAPEGESRGILDLFGMLSEELMNEGFLADLMNKIVETEAPNRETRRAIKKKK